jgi:hypothetical protein
MIGKNDMNGKNFPFNLGVEMLNGNIIFEVAHLSAVGPLFDENFTCAPNPTPASPVGHSSNGGLIATGAVLVSPTFASRPDMASHLKTLTQSRLNKRQPCA